MTPENKALSSLGTCDPPTGGRRLGFWLLFFHQVLRATREMDLKTHGRRTARAEASRPHLHPSG